MGTPAGDGLVGDATIRVDGDTDPALRALSRFSRDAEGRIRDTRGRFVRETGEISAALRRVGRPEPTITVNTDPALRAIRQFSTDAQGRLRDERGRFVREGDSTGRGIGGGILTGLGTVVSAGISATFTSAMSGLRGAAETMQTNPYVRAIGTGLAAGVVATALPLIGALISGAVITVSGLGIIGLGAALLKNEPEIKAAAGRLSETVRTTFENAAQHLKAPFETALGDLQQTVKDVAPQVDQAFKTVADSGALKSLTDGIDKLVKNALPGFNDMLTKSKPVFEGLEVLMSEVGTGLGNFFQEVGRGGPGAKRAFEDIGAAISLMLTVAGRIIGDLGKAYGYIRGFIDKVVGAFDWLYNVLVGNSIVPDTINAIVRWFAGLPGRAAGALSSLGGKIVSVASSALRSMVSTVSAKVSEAVGWLRGLPGRAAGALAALGGRLRGRASEAGRSMVTAISGKVSEAVAAVRGMPGRAAAALGDLGSRLYSSGRALVSGFVSGIKSKIGDVVSAASSVVSRARDLFPGSPAKEGPFSGRGWVLFSGRAVSEALAEGMAQRAAMVQRAAALVAGAAQDAVSPLASRPVVPGMPAGAGGLSLGVMRADGGRGATVVHQNVNLYFENSGVMGSRLEVANWMAEVLDDLNRTGRLPKAV